MRLINVSSVHNFYDTRIQSHLNSSQDSFFWGFCDESNSKLIFDLGRSSPKKRAFFSIDALRRFKHLSSQDIVIIHDPELLPLAFILKLFLCRKVFFDAHENILSDIKHKYWIHPLVNKIYYILFSILLHVILPTMSGILTVTPSLVEYYRRYNKFVYFLPNWPLEFPSTNLSIEDKAINLRHCYVGSISRQRGAIEICELAMYLKHPILLIGSITDINLQLQMESHPGWKNIEYKGFLPNYMLNSLLKNQDIGLLLMDDIDTFRNSYPVKILDYAKNGLVTLWTGRSDCEYSKLVQQFPNYHLAEKLRSINFQDYLLHVYSYNCLISGYNYSWSSYFTKFQKCVES